MFEEFDRQIQLKVFSPILVRIRKCENIENVRVIFQIFSFPNSYWGVAAGITSSQGTGKCASLNSAVAGKPFFIFPESRYFIMKPSLIIIRLCDRVVPASGVAIRIPEVSGKLAYAAGGGRQPEPPTEHGVMGWISH